MLNVKKAPSLILYFFIFILYIIDENYLCFYTQVQVQRFIFFFREYLYIYAILMLNSNG